MCCYINSSPKPPADRWSTRENRLVYNEYIRLYLNASWYSYIIMPLKQPIIHYNIYRILIRVYHIIYYYNHHLQYILNINTYYINIIITGTPYMYINIKALENRHRIYCARNSVFDRDKANGSEDERRRENNSMCDWEWRRTVFINGGPGPGN